MSPWEKQMILNSLRSRVASTSSTASPNIPASQSWGAPGEAICSGVGNSQSKMATIIDNTLPNNWDYIKLDLFNNANVEELIQNKNKFRLAISVKVKGAKYWQSFRVALNSPFRNLKRGLDTATYESTHYRNVIDSYNILKQNYRDVRVSKAYMKGSGIKGQTTEYLTAVLVPLEEGYAINLHFKEQQWLWKLGSEVSDLQRKKNVVGTIGIRPAPKVKNLNAGDFL